ncbi:MAG: hypothetical protein M0Z50_04250 [Planctomycetia bacterium]|nr:hypothetical protein [Planctomycetia bacterium]
MRRKIRRWICFTVILLVSAAPSQMRAAAEPRIAFDSAGRPLTFSTRQGRANLVDRQNPGLGFYLMSFNGRHIRHMRLRVVRLSGNKLYVSTGRGLPRFTFKISRGSRFLSLNLIRIQGLPRESLASLSLNIRGETTLRCLALDYMTRINNLPGDITVHWPYLWHRNPADPLGGVALYHASTPKSSDNALAQIWADTDFPHPAIGKRWTVARVKTWVKNYYKRFRDLTTMYIAPHNPAQLYKLTGIARRAGVKVINLMNNIWSYGFWPANFSQVSVNRKMFPNGRADLAKYAAYLHRHGMLLYLHSVTGGIGPFDPKAMDNPSLLRGLAAWAQGTLARPVSNSATTLYFRPNPGNEYPLVTSNPAGPDELGSFFSTNFVRVGNEIVQVGRFENLDKPVWKLVGSHRGYGVTKAVAHPAGASAAGLDSAYGQVFSPGADSPWMARVARQFADFINQVGADHCAYDGYEDQLTVPWGDVKYSNLVASFLDRPVTSATSRGAPASANLEMKFSAVKKNILPQCVYASVNLSIKLAGISPASSLLGAAFEIPAGICLGGRRFVIIKPEPMFGISMFTLDHYGLVGPMFRTFRMWKRAFRKMTPAQLRTIANTMAPATRYNHLNQRGYHLAGRDCFVISRSGDHYGITPTRVMVRKKGDVRWLVGQEFGPVAPYQYIQPGQRLLLRNPYKAQPAGFIIYVLSALGADKSKPIPLRAADIRNQVQAAIRQSGHGIVIRAVNPLSTSRWISHGLPTWDHSLSMAHARALSLRVTGDGKGEVLLVQIHGGGVRDYVVKVSFTGTRTIVIPNGEVSWANGCWGWRFNAKVINYARIHRLSIGFGYLPPQSRLQVRVSHLMALTAHPSTLVNPVIQTGTGKLRVMGTVPTGDYLEYRGGNTAVVYGRNWNKKNILPVRLADYVMPGGYAPVGVKVAAGAPLPWLRCEFITRGAPLWAPAR